MRLPRPWPRLFWRSLKRLTPTSLFGRSLLIIVLPVALMQIAVTYVFFDAHWQTVNSHLTEGLAGDVALILQTYEEDPSAASLKRLEDRAQANLDLSIMFQDGGVLPRGRRPSLFVAVDRSLRKALSDRIDVPFWFDTGRYPAYVDVRVKVPGGVLRIIAPKDRVFATRGHIFIFWLTAATVLLTGISIVFIRNQVRAIERLAYAADAFGRGADVAFRPHGAREVRLAARAFLAMKARIQRHVDQRTILLAAVSHDLRTPLTRLKLELALSPPGSRIEAMKADLAEMEHMIDEYLAFARGEGGEDVETVRVVDIIDDVRDGAARSGVGVVVDAAPDVLAHVRPGALKRALTNLVSNAVGHGGRVEITARNTLSGGVEIHVDDDGPGISPDRYDDAFAPFSRLEAARGPNTKGVGLGLAIARDVARGHGGDVTLSASPLGGLRATVTLP
ncbi:MAG: sensor histidine kinase [Caulobacteraceae bacterium]|jgi:two-component system osmolarity sensor histidine kinase EnvZ|nr:sensor histidine kinase [Caulobacteraceae bacterium]